MSCKVLVFSLGSSFDQSEYSPLKSNIYAFECTLHRNSVSPTRAVTKCDILLVKEEPLPGLADFVGEHVDTAVPGMEHLA